MANVNKKTSEVSFEDALKELEVIVRDLESGEKDLKSSIGAYERGMELKKLCESKLKEAQAKIEKITISSDGSSSTEVFNLEH